MTDVRMGESLWAALDRLPRGGGVVFRHYELPVAERRALFRRVSRVARRRRLILLGTGGVTSPDGSHNIRTPRGIQSRSAHTARDILAAEHAGVDLVFVSPVFATRSHPGAAALGAARFGAMIRGARIPVIALGGMDAKRARSLAALGIYGWAGIDAWL